MLVVCVCLNSIEIHILRKKTHRKGHEKILLSLSICDLGYQVVSSIFRIVTVLAIANKSQQIVTIIWVIWGFPALFALMVSIMHLMLMTLDKLWAIVSPLTHTANARGRRVNKMITLCWLISLSIIISNIAVVIWKKLEIVEISHFLTQKTAKIAAYLMTVANGVFVVSYSVIYWIICKQPHHGHIYARRRVKKSTLVLCIGVVLSLSLSTIPFVVVHVVTWDPPQSLVQAGYSLLAVNSNTNSIVFLISNYCHRRSKRTKQKSSKVKALRTTSTAAYELHSTTSM